MEALRPMVDHCHGALSYPMLSQEKSYLISSNLIQPNLVYSNPSILFISLCVYVCDAMRYDAMRCISVSVSAWRNQHIGHPEALQAVLVVAGVAAVVGPARPDSTGDADGIPAS